MGSTEKINSGDAGFESLLGRYLLLRSRGESPNLTADHLDEDTLTAFTEGNLTFRESDSAVMHLADCSFCRHKTAELVRLELALAEPDAVSQNLLDATHEPSKVSEVLGGILSGLFGGGESAVFAHEEKDEAADKDGKVATDQDKEKK